MFGVFLVVFRSGERLLKGRSLNQLPFSIQKGFPAIFVDLVMSSMTHGNVDVMLNDRIGPFFEYRKGPGQGYLLSPILFHLAIDVPNVLL